MFAVTSNSIYYLFSNICFYWLSKKQNLNQRVLSISIFLGLVSRWSVSLLVNLEYTTNMSYTPFSKLEDLIKEDILPMVFILISLLVAKGKNLIKNKTYNIFDFYINFIIFPSLFFVPEGALWNGRLIPFFNLGIFFYFSKP